SPFESLRTPWIGTRRGAMAQRPEQVAQWQEIADRKNRRARRRQDVQDLEFRRVFVIAPRHAEIAENELRKEREIEAEEHEDRGEPRPAIGIHPAGDLGPPEMHPAQERHYRPS